MKRSFPFPLLPVTQFFTRMVLMTTSRYCCHPKKNHKLETIPVLSLHILAAGAIGIVATGASALTSGTSSTSDLTLLRVGMCMLLLTWVLLLLLAVFSLLPSQRKREAPGYKDGLQVCIPRYRFWVWIRSTDIGYRSYMQCYWRYLS